MGGPFGQPIGGLKGSLNINFGSDGVYCKKIDFGSGVFCRPNGAF